LATGKDLKTAATGGLLSAGVDYLYGEPAAGASGADKTALAVEKGLTSMAVNQLFAPTQTSQSSQTVGGGFTPSDTSVTTTGAGQSPGSQALAQALRVVTSAVYLWRWR
jgi:hypothetical protein